MLKEIERGAWKIRWQGKLVRQSDREEKGGHFGQREKKGLWPL